MCRRQGELKYGSPRLIGICPQPAPMGGDDGPANRQAHSDSALLCRVEGFENPLEMFRIDAGSRIVHCDEDVSRLPLLGADQTTLAAALRPSPLLRPRSGSNSGRLVAVERDRRERKSRPPRGGCEPRLYFCRLGLRTISITSWIASLRSKRLIPWRCFLDVITDAVDDIFAAVGIPDDTSERFPDFGHVWRASCPKNAWPHERCCAQWRLDAEFREPERPSILPSCSRD